MKFTLLKLYKNIENGADALGNVLTKDVAVGSCKGYYGAWNQADIVLHTREVLATSIKAILKATEFKECDKIDLEGEIYSYNTLKRGKRWVVVALRRCYH